MAKMTIGKGVDEYIASLDSFKNRVPEIAGKALYQGAKVVADQIRANIEALPTEERKGAGRGRRNPTPEEKQGLLDGLGIARKRIENGNINVSIGMDGYNSDVTEKWPKGHPNAMIARSIESGTSFTIRHPFISSAVRSSKAAAEEAMRSEVDKQVEEIMGSG